MKDIHDALCVEHGTETTTEEIMAAFSKSEMNKGDDGDVDIQEYFALASLKC